MRWRLRRFFYTLLVLVVILLVAFLLIACGIICLKDGR